MSDSPTGRKPRPVELEFKYPGREVRGNPNQETLRKVLMNIDYAEVEGRILASMSPEQYQEHLDRIAKLEQAAGLRKAEAKQVGEVDSSGET